MRILCPITKWQERVAERGKGKGNILRERAVIAADKWNWIYAIQTKDENGPLIEKKYYGNFRTLLSSCDKSEYKSIAVFVVSALEKSLDISVEIEFDQGAEELGKTIDNVFDVSFARNLCPDVYQRLFKEEPSESEEEK